MTVPLFRGFAWWAGIALLLSVDAFGASVWTNANSGLWRGSSNWASGSLPSITSGIYITNAGTKAVTIDAPTPPQNLVINSLNVWAPNGGSNTLRLADVGTNNPLVLSNVNLTIRTRGALQITNSSLIVTNVFNAPGVDFNIWAGSVTLDSGSIIVRGSAADTNLVTPTRIGRTNVAMLTINGGFMYSSMMDVGQAGILNARSHGTVQMTGGLLTVPGELSIGTSLNCTGVVNMVGGRLVVPNNLTNITRVGDQGYGRLFVSNAIASLGNVSVGRHPNSDGLLVMLKDGLAGTSDDFSIGRFGNSTGMVFMADGQLVVTNHPIWVGREGNGQLIVSNGLVSASEIRVAAEFTNTARGTVLIAGGTTALSTALTIGRANFSTGEVTVAGGSLVVSNADQTAVLEIPGGTLTLNGGSTATDSLLMTSEIGALTFNAGRLITSGSTVSNGLPFVVGDGINPATLELRGGTHYFANGLIISPNATLTGCGIIIGEVSNYGTNSINCGDPGSPPYIIEHPHSRTVASGAAVTFTVVASSSNAMTFQWRHAGTNLAGANSDSFTLASAQPADTGAYDVIVSNNSGSVTSRVANLSLAQGPVMTSQPASVAVALNAPATFGATAVGAAPLSYQWLLNSNVIAGATSSNYTIASAQLVQAGDYNLVVSNSVGSITSVVASLLVLVPPAITVQPVSQNVASNSPVTFNVTATGSPSLLYQWRYNGVAIPGATDTNFALPSAQLTNVGNYTVVVKNPVGSVTSLVATLTFPGPPVIVIQPASQTNARNTSVTFSVVSSGSNPLKFQWRFNNNNVSSATNSTYTRSNLGSGDAGNYTVVVTNSSGAVTSQVAVLTVLTVVSITSQPVSKNATQGVTATLSVVVAGSSPVSYQWRFAPPGQGETNIIGATSATLTLNNPQTNNTGNYRVVASNPVSAITSQVATVTVLAPPAIAVQPLGVTAPPGSNVTFNVTATGGSLNYLWRKNGTNISGATSSSYAINNVQATNAGNYTVVISNTVGSVTSSVAVLRVLVPPQILNLSLAGGTASVSFQSLSGLGYVLEYKNQLTNGPWAAQGSVPGNGGLLSLSNSTANTTSRAYRVRVE